MWLAEILNQSNCGKNSKHCYKKSEKQCSSMFISAGLADNRESMPQGESVYARSRFESGPSPCLNLSKEYSMHQLVNPT